MATLSMAIKDFIETMAPLQPILTFTRLLRAERFQFISIFSFYQAKDIIRIECMADEVNLTFREIICTNISKFARMMETFLFRQTSYI